MSEPGADPDAPWALSLVVRVERPGVDGGPPAHTDVLVAADAAAVLDPLVADLVEAARGFRG